jgi:hypothetical protein
MNRFLLLLALSLALTGCSGLFPAAQTDPTRYYVLTGPVAAPSAPGALRVGVRRVELAAYLKSPDLIVRRGANELVLQDYARWGETIDAGVSRLLQASLAAAPGVGRVYVQPFPLDQDRDCDVAVTILRCEGGTDSLAHFAATVEITHPSDGKLLARFAFAAPDAAWDGHDFGRLAALLSDDVAALGREIAAALPAAGR